MDRHAITLVCNWNGGDLFDSAEDEGMLLTVRAVFRVSCEFVSLLRNHFRSTLRREGSAACIREPIQDDSWVSFRFPYNEQQIDCVAVWVAADDDTVYAFTFSPVKRLFQRKVQLIPEGFERVIEQALAGNHLITAQRWISPDEISKLWERRKG